VASTVVGVLSVLMSMMTGMPVYKNQAGELFIGQVILFVLSFRLMSRRSPSERTSSGPLANQRDLKSENLTLNE